MQIFNHGVDKLAAAALRIKVFVSKDERAVVRPGALRGNKECSGMPEMQISGG